MTRSDDRASQRRSIFLNQSAKIDTHTNQSIRELEASKFDYEMAKPSTTLSNHDAVGDELSGSEHRARTQLLQF